MGFAETSYQTAYESPTGNYTINVYLVRDGKRDLLLGETSVIVKEFLPDRMKIESRLSKEAKAGWVTPDDVRAAITLRNLYGTPATGSPHQGAPRALARRISLRGVPGFTFLRPPARRRKRR